jgi:glycosyltransferase involved in cell wall biosynthesis
MAFLNCAKCALARANLLQFPPALPVFALPLAMRNHNLRAVLSQATNLIAPTNFVKQWYVDRGFAAEKIAVMPWGLDYPSKPAGPSHTSFRVGYLGGISWQKGVHLLVEAFAQLPLTAELWIAGDIEFDPDYVKLLKGKGRATFLGNLNRQQVWEMLAQVDVVVVPSLWYETFCFVISEAFAMGVPVITHNLGALRERVRPGIDGLLVAPGDVEQLAQALQTLHDDPSLLDKLRQNILPIGTVAEHAAAVAQLYHEALRQNHKMRK